jgi:hypothetical protein
VGGRAARCRRRRRHEGAIWVARWRILARRAPADGSVGIRTMTHLARLVSEVWAYLRGFTRPQRIKWFVPNRNWICQLQASRRQPSRKSGAAVMWPPARSPSACDRTLSSQFPAAACAGRAKSSAFLPAGSTITCTPRPAASLFGSNFAESVAPLRMMPRLRHLYLFNTTAQPDNAGARSTP